jgi:transcriptional regulator with XRE-family HTH domain
MSYKFSKKSYRASPPQLKLFKTRMNNAIAKKIVELIESRRYSKLQFAVLMKKDPSVISRWISGAHNFTIETLCEISFKTQTPITEMLDCYYLYKGYWQNPDFINLCERIEL